jgi:hypothetical protein
MAAPAADDIIDALEVIAQNGIPATGRAWITDVRSGPYIDFFEDEILGHLVASGGSTCRIFEAVYGAGKTHLLDLFFSLASRREWQLSAPTFPRRSASAIGNSSPLRSSRT